MSWLHQPLIPGGILLLGAAVPPIPAYGPAVAASLLLDLDGGFRVSLEWQTDLEKSISGKEKRTQIIGAPRQRYNGRAQIVDGDDRRYRATLVQHAAAGSAFLLGLPYEELSIAADSTGAVITVHSTTYAADWLQPGQRVLVVDVDDNVVNRDGFVVQSSGPTSITLNASAVVKRGGRIMPAMAVYLEPAQGLARRVVNVTEPTIAVRSAEYGFAGVDAMGVGATLTTYVDPVTSHEYVVWDRRDIDEQTDDSMQSQAEIVDLGGVPIGVGNALEPDWGRQVQLTGDAHEWRWLKAFLFAAYGRQKTWLLPTWRPDLVYVGVDVGELIVASAEAEGGGDIIAWLDASPEHRRLLVEYDFGDWYIVNVEAYVDNLDGTVTLTTDLSLDPDPTLISFCELVRWESDSFDVQWQGGTFEFTAMARVVQQ